jgi:hypothetical protein
MGVGALYPNAVHASHNESIIPRSLKVFWGAASAGCVSAVSSSSFFAIVSCFCSKSESSWLDDPLDSWLSFRLFNAGILGTMSGWADEIRLLWCRSVSSRSPHQNSRHRKSLPALLSDWLPQPSLFKNYSAPPSPSYSPLGVNHNDRHFTIRNNGAPSRQKAPPCGPPVCILNLSSPWHPQPKINGHPSRCQRSRAPYHATGQGCATDDGA